MKIQSNYIKWNFCFGGLIQCCVLRIQNSAWYIICPQWMFSECMIEKQHWFYMSVRQQTECVGNISIYGWKIFTSFKWSLQEKRRAQNTHVVANGFLYTHVYEVLWEELTLAPIPTPLPKVHFKHSALTTSLLLPLA